MPGSNPFYELMGGYYPGDPIQGRKPSAGKPPQPLEFHGSYDMIDDYLAGLRKSLSKHGLSERAKDLFIDDVKRALTAKAGPKDDSVNADRNLELGDRGDSAGVQLEVDITKEWIINPVEQAKKTLGDWKDDLINYQDFSADGEQKALWVPLVTGQETTPFIESAFGEHIGKRDGTAIPRGEFHPFQVAGLGIRTKKAVPVLASGELDDKGAPVASKKLPKEAGGDDLMSEVDLFRGAGTSFTSLGRKVRQSGGRDTSFRKFAKATAIATGAEIMQLDAAGKLEHLSEKQKLVVDEYTQRAKALRLANGVTGIDFNVYHFDKKGGGTEEWGRTGMGIDMLSKSLGKYALGALPDRTNAAGDTISKEKGLIGTFETAESGIKGLAKQLADIDTWYVEKKQDLEGLAQFQKDTKGMRKTLERLLGDEQSGKTGLLAEVGETLNKLPDGGNLSRAQRLAMQTQVGIVKGKLDNLIQRYESTGPIKSSMDHMSHGFINKQLLNGEIRDIISENPELFKGSLNMLNVADAASAMYRREDFNDLIDKLEKDGVTGITSDFFWNRSRAYLNGLTPAKMVEEQLKRTHYLGLVYDPNYAIDSDITGELSNKGNKVINSIMETGPLKGLFENAHDIKVDIDGIEHNFNFVGNRSLKIGLDLYDRTQLGATDAKFLKMNEVIDLLNPESELLGKVVDGRLIGYDAYSFMAGFDGGLEDIKLRSDAFRTWLMEHGAEELGIKFENLLDEDGNVIPGLYKLVNDEENQKKLEALFSALSDREGNVNYVSILQQKVGLLQKSAQKLNILQNKIFNSKLGKALRFPTYVREVMSKKAAKAITQAIRVGVKAVMKVLGAAATDATAGIAAVVWPIIELAVQYIVNKTLDAAQKFYETIKEGDFAIIEEFLEKGAGMAIKACGTFVIIFGCCVAAPLSIVFIILLSAITPIDSTRATFMQDRASTPGGYPAGPTSLCNVDGQGLGPRRGADCFNFNGSFANGGGTAQAVLEFAKDYIVQNFGGFTDKICAYGDVEIEWSPSGTDCGWSKNKDLVSFGSAGCYLYDVEDERSQNIFIWLMAHELAHTLDRRQSGDGYVYNGEPNTEFEQSFQDAVNADCGLTNPTYVGGSGENCSPSLPGSEDMAETIANYIALHRDCGTNIPNCDDYWKTDWSTPGCTLENHLEWVEENVFD